MNLTDSLLGAICLVFLLVLLGTLTQERAASLELGRSAELMDDLASAAEACARDHESELSLTTGPEGNPSVLREAGYLRPSFPDFLADGRPLRFFLRRLTADSAPLILAVAEGTPASWKENAGSERRFASLYALPLAKKLPGGGYVSTTGSGRDETTLQGARSSFTLSLKSLGISLPPGTTVLLRLADTDGTEPGTADSSAFLHRKAEEGLNTMLSDLGFSAHALRDTGAAVFAPSSQGADTAAADAFAALCQAGDTGSGSPEGLTRYIPGAGLAVCRNGRAALLGRDSAFLSAAGVFFAGPSDGVITNLATPLRTFSRPGLQGKGSQRGGRGGFLARHREGFPPPGNGKKGFPFRRGKLLRLRGNPGACPFGQSSARNGHVLRRGCPAGHVFLHGRFLSPRHDRLFSHTLARQGHLMQLADTLLALFVLCAAFAGAATLQGAERCRDDAGAAAWQADTLRIAARQLPPSSTPETVRLSVPDDLTSLPPGFSAEGAGGRPFLVLVKKTAGGTDILVLAKGTASGNDALPRAAALRLKGGFYRPSDRRARALGLSASSVWLPGEGRALNLASFGLTAVPEGSFGILDGPGAGQTDALREEILRREPLSGHEELSVMETDLGLSGHALEDVSALRFLNTYSGPASTLSGFGSLPAPEDYSGPAETPAALCAGENNTGRLILDSRFGLGLCRDGRFALLADSENSLSVRNMGVTSSVSLTSNGGTAFTRGTIPVPVCRSGEEPAVFFAPMRTGMAVPWIPKDCLSALASTDGQKEALERIPARYFRAAGPALLRSAVSRSGSVWMLTCNLSPDTLAMRPAGSTLKKNSPDLAAAQDLIADWYYASGQVTRPAGSSAPRTLPAACPSPGFDRPVPFAWFTACITEAVP